MRSRNARRVGVVAWPFVVGAVLLASCGSDDGAAPSQSTIELNNGSTAFVVKEPATTLPTEGVAEDGTTTTSQEYTVQSGDYPLGVAEMFGITLEELVNFNEWSSADEFPFPGETIKIPPGASAPTTTTKKKNNNADSAETADTEAEETGDTIPEAGDNCDEGTYTVEEGDYPLDVADKFDVTVEALNAANSDLPGYSAFYTGLEIVIPAKSDC